MDSQNITTLLESTVQIRHEQTARNGFSFEVILKEPTTAGNLPKRFITTRAVKKLSVNEIYEKLIAAERKREILAQSRVGTVYRKLDIAAQRRLKSTNNFKQRTELNLKTKLMEHTERRKLYLEDVQQKMRKEIFKVQKVYLEKKAGLDPYGEKYETESNEKQTINEQYNQLIQSAKQRKMSSVHYDANTEKVTFNFTPDLIEQMHNTPETNTLAEQMTENQLLHAQCAPQSNEELNFDSVVVSTAHLSLDQEQIREKNANYSQLFQAKSTKKQAGRELI